MKRQWKYQTNNHHYFSQMFWADRLFNINGIMCVLTFSNCLGTFRTEYFIMPLVLQCSFQKILPAWNKCMTLDFLVRRPQINLPFKEAFPVFKSDRNFRQTWKYTFILIHIYTTHKSIYITYKTTGGTFKCWFAQLSSCYHENPGVAQSSSSMARNPQAVSTRGENQIKG